MYQIIKKNQSTVSNAYYYTWILISYNSWCILFVKLIPRLWYVSGLAKRRSLTQRKEEMNIKQVSCRGYGTRNWLMIGTQFLWSREIGFWPW